MVAAMLSAAVSVEEWVCANLAALLDGYQGRPDVVEWCLNEHMSESEALVRAICETRMRTPGLKDFWQSLEASPDLGPDDACHDDRIDLYPVFRAVLFDLDVPREGWPEPVRKAAAALLDAVTMKVADGFGGELYRECVDARAPDY